MESPARLFGSGSPEDAAGALTRKPPKALAMLPGATGAPAAKLAPFTTPPALIEGAGGALGCVICTDTPATEIVVLRAAPGLAAAKRVNEAEPAPEEVPGVIQLGRPETVQKQPEPVWMPTTRFPPTARACNEVDETE
jgi:hypothetical protein